MPSRSWRPSRRDKQQNAPGTPAGPGAREIGDAHDALIAERDENTARKPMLLSEATALGMAIQEMEAPAAKERQASTRFGGVPGNTTVESDKWGHKTRDIAENTARKPMLPTEAAALGMAIEEMEKPAAIERMTSGRNQYSEPSAPGSRGLPGERPRDIAAVSAGPASPPREFMID